MKFMKQFAIILLISFLGECARELLPLPVPASIYGLVFMLIALMTGIVKTEDVNRAGMFLIETMPMMFIPAAVGIMAAWNVFRPICGPVVITIVVSTILVMGVSGLVTQQMIRWNERKRK